MSKVSLVAKWCLLIIVLVAVLPVPLRADLTADGLTTALVTARDEAKKPVTTWQTAVTKKTTDDFDTVKDKLVATWGAERGKAITAVGEALDKQRQAITDQLTGDAERLNRVSKKLKELFEARIKALTDASAKFDVDAAAFQGTAAAADKAEALKKLKALADAFSAPLSEAEWFKVIESAKAAFAEPSANQQVQEAAKSVQGFINSVERDFSRFVHCDYEGKTNSLVCDKALAVSGAEISSIDVRGLPANKNVIITASTARENVVRSGNSAPDWDSVSLTAPHPDQVQVAVYLYRSMLPAYRPEMRAYRKFKAEEAREAGDNAADGQERRADVEATSEEELAARALREYRADDDTTPAACQNGQAPRLLCRRASELALVVSGKAPSVRVTVEVENADGTFNVVSATLELGYARWGVDTGGFYALSWLADEQLKTEPVPGSDTMVRIARRGGGSDLTPDTGIFLNLVPKNYPIFGVGLGFSANKDQPNTFYLGGSLRLLSFRNRGVASFSTGVTVRSVKRFPGLNEGAEVSKTDPKLQGTTQLKAAPYAVVQLGFSFGRIPGAKDGN